MITAIKFLGVVIKGLLKQSTAELQITSTALQVGISRSALEEAVNKFLIPIWAFVSLMGTAVIDSLVLRTFPERRKIKF